MKRWYDNDQKLSQYFQKIQELNKSKRDKVIKNIILKIQGQNKEILSDLVFDFLLETRCRRWYDNDSRLWFLFNGLKQAPNTMLENIYTYLDNQFKEIE